MIFFVAKKREIFCFLVFGFLTVAFVSEKKCFKIAVKVSVFPIPPRFREFSYPTKLEFSPLISTPGTGPYFTVRSLENQKIRKR